MGNVAHDVDFTATSGVVCSDRGELSLGFEASYPEVSPPDGFWRSRKTIAINPLVNFVTIYGGSLAMRPQSPQSAGLFGGGMKAVVADILVRVYFGERMVVNRNLKADFFAVNQAIEPFVFEFGAGEPREITVEFTEAGPGRGTSIELELAAGWQ